MAMAPLQEINLDTRQAISGKIDKIALYFINEDGTYRQKTVPMSANISYPYLADFGQGWMVRGLFDRVQRLCGGKLRPEGSPAPSVADISRLAAQRGGNMDGIKVTDLPTPATPVPAVNPALPPTRRPGRPRKGGDKS